MKFVLSILLPLIVVLSACQPLVAPEGMVAAGDNTATDPMVEVNFYTSHEAHLNLGKIDLTSGAGTDIGEYTNPEVTIARDEWLTGDGAIYENMLYLLVNKRLPADATPEDAQAHLTKVDIQTGKFELVGSTIPLNVLALEIDPCGVAYTAGFTLSNQFGELYGDTNLYRIDRGDGSLTLIGNTGIERIMDMAFDPEGTLWGTVGNVLYTLDTETGTQTAMATITGVEDDNEIMGIGFTSEGDLFGTTPFSDGFYRIDLESGAVTEVGRHGFTIPHGGDIPMTPREVHCESGG